MLSLTLLFLFLLAPALVSAGCPFLESKTQVASASAYEKLNYDRSDPDKRRLVEEYEEYYAALDALDFAALEQDIVTLMHTSQDWWPSDWQEGSEYPVPGGHYGPLFIRMAWHCAGSYRRADGRGGCNGGRLRFEPERAWFDNANLDKAINLLWPIKEKYGLGLSWGDLITFTGTIAIKDMGGPYMGFCAGRMDDKDGDNSLGLGPTQEQEIVAPCAEEDQGNCQEPLGPMQVGMIYVNAEGHMGVPVPSNLVPDIRDVFSRMGMNDTETVALIGGGHAFGKCHAACPDGPGPNPQEQPEDPWPGLCGDGKGENTSTSEFEGGWTHKPTEWTNIYFDNLFRWTWKREDSPRNHTQWVVDQPVDPADTSTPPSTIMLTADLALLEDESYKAISLKYRDNMDALTSDFNHAWYKLMNGDMGPVTRCHGPDVPPAQPFQWPLPDPLPADQLPDFNAVAESIKVVMHTENAAVLPMDSGGYGPLFVRLAWQCANPFRNTDKKGGCNGARIRLLPQSAWSANVAMDKAMELLEPVKIQYGDSLSWADLIVLSGKVGLEEASDSISLTFTGGRTDAPDTEEPDLISNQLQLLVNGGDQNDGIEEMMNMQDIWGLTFNEVVALIGGGHSLGRVHYDRSGFQSGQWTTNPNVLDIEYFQNLLNYDWTIINGDTDKIQYTSTAADGTPLQMLRSDMNLRFGVEYRAVVEQYLADPNLFYADFSSAWMKMMEQDMFGMTTSSEVETTSDEDDDDEVLSRTGLALITGFAGGIVGLLLAVLIGYFVLNTPKSSSQENTLKDPLNTGPSSSEQRTSVTEIRASSSKYVPPHRESNHDDI